MLKKKLWLVGLGVGFGLGDRKYSLYIIKIVTLMDTNAYISTNNVCVSVSLCEREWDMTPLSLFTRPNVIPNLYDLFLFLGRLSL